MRDETGPDSVSERAIARLLRGAGHRAAPSPARREQARVAIREAWHDAARSRARRRFVRIALPAAAAAAIVLLTLRQAPMTPPADSGAAVARIVASTAAVRVVTGGAVRIAAAGDSVAAGSTVMTPAGTVVSFGLEDGGELRQNGDASIRWTGSRQVTLERGEIYVDSGQTGGGAIAIDTPAGVVSDIGTRFAVRVEGRSLRVRVREGIVRLDSAGRARDVRSGRVLVADGRGGVRVDAAPTFGDEWAWILQGTRFRLEGATLARFLQWIEVEGGRTVELSDAALASAADRTVLHGSIAGLSVEEALDAVLPTIGLTYRIDGARVIVTRPRGVAR